MKKIIPVIIFCIATFSFSNLQAKDMLSPADKAFNSYKERFVLSLWKINPGWASSVGFHKYDNVLVIPDQKSRILELDFCNKQLDSLSRFKLDDLSDANKTDHHMMENQLKYTQWGIQEQKAWQWDPSSYNVSSSFADMLGNDYAPLEERLRNFARRMAAIPAYYKAAEHNIKNPTLEHTALAIEQNLGGISVFEQDLPDALKRSTLEQKEKDAMLAKAATAVLSIKEYTEWLKNLKNENPRSFRLGKELYGQKFGFEIQSGYTADEIYQKALKHKQELHDEMYKLTEKLWPKYFAGHPIRANKMEAIQYMIEKLSENHVKADSFQAAIEAQIPALVAFIKKNNLIYIDSSKPLVIRKEPAYMAGVAGASINAPGPYDKNGNTYYNVGSLSGWDKNKAESYLREYNHYILQILNIHEAIPGHYTQLVYANQSPSIIKAILGNNAMIEGWAVYTERMMLESGYDGDNGINSAMASPEMWLMYYKWNLRSTCNTILDYSVHTKNMSKEAALELLTKDAFQQQAEAEGKWKRVSVTQVQLDCYFTGYTEIYEFRQELKNKLKIDFRLKAFHEKFLSYGSAPVKYIKELMMKDMK
ncbi:MAG: hypothetical protein JWQ38_2112 [Flavipsychrobacter sp.]|nr:hypothetical protein [Flavipsychrobacter sp.]